MKNDLLFAVIDLTKREYFAGLCLQGMLANSTNKLDFARMAEEAVLATEALIAALDAKSKGEP